MSEGFNPWRGAVERDCRTCQHATGTPDGWHLWCELHRIVVVSPCGLWEREPGTDNAAQLGASGEAGGTLSLLDFAGTLSSVTDNPGARVGEIAPDHAPVIARFGL